MPDTHHRAARLVALLATVLLTMAGWPYSTLSHSRSPVLPAGPAQISGLTPFLDLLPASDGDSMFMDVRGTGQISGELVANADFRSGPTSHKGGYTLAYSGTIDSYYTIIPNFSPQFGASGTLQLTTTLGLASSSVAFERPYLPAGSIGQFSLADGQFRVDVVTSTTFVTPHYLALFANFGLPGAAPAGHRVIGSAYSVRASGAITEADRPMLLHLRFDQTNLAGADPRSLAVFFWSGQAWTRLDGQLLDQPGVRELSVATARFGTYALMATPTWADPFDDLDGLMTLSNVVQASLDGGRDRALTLAPGATSGSVLSSPIAPPGPFNSWSELVFDAAATPPGGQLQVDLLSLDGTLLRSDVASGTDLATIDPKQYPALQLRARFSAPDQASAPQLSRWQLSWRVADSRIFLPSINR